MMLLALLSIVVGSVCVGVLVGIILCVSRRRPWERVAFQALTYAYEANRTSQAYRMQYEELLRRQAA